jgi:CHASE2 domain-containing sensor protein
MPRVGLIVIRAYLDTYRRVSEFLARTLRQNFYLYLAAVFSLLALLDVLVFHQVLDMRQKTFDLVIKNRIIKPKPDPDIVVVDVNEPSLAAMAKEYGRWPWPRQVFGEFIEHLQQQKPKAIVFDVLFSDPDVYNPDSDAYFNEVVAGTDNTYFPFLRLGPGHDKLSELKAQQIPGVKPAPEQPQGDKTVAVIMPFFEAVQRSGRLGFITSYPDRDGILRSYRLYQDEGGWRLPSLPARVADGLGWAQPAHRDLLLNWRGKPFTYRFVTFSDVYTDMLSKDKQRPQDEFKDKIVLIGSTAPTLFDVKPTSMAKEYPGVEIIATALDNLKHDDYIRVPTSRWPYLIAALLILWGTGFAFYKDVEAERFAKVFGLSQVGLLVLSYLSINLTNFYLNLTGPVFIGFVYFSIAKLYALATARALERNLLAESLKRGGSLIGTMAVFHIHGRDDTSTGMFMRALKKAVERDGTAPKDVEVLRGKQRGIFGLLDSTLVVSWVYPRDDEATRGAVEAEAKALLERMPELVDRSRISGEVLEASAVHSMAMGGADGHATPNEWRRLFAEALEKAAR